MSRRADAASGSHLVAADADPEPSCGIGPASVMNAACWPRQSYLELGALPSAVPSARLHARAIMAEWGLDSIADTVELVVSELVTNGVKASSELVHKPPVWLGLSSDDHQALIAVWDGNDEPIQEPAGGDELPDIDAEGGRGLLLVDSLSADWGVHWLEDGSGKVVWSVIAAYEPDTAEVIKGQPQADVVVLPKRVASSTVVRPARRMDDLAVLERVRAGLNGLG